GEHALSRSLVEPLQRVVEALPPACGITAAPSFPVFIECLFADAAREVRRRGLQPGSNGNPCETSGPPLLSPMPLPCGRLGGRTNLYRKRFAHRQAGESEPKEADSVPPRCEMFSSISCFRRGGQS